jgi:hypothetical protein
MAVAVLLAIGISLWLLRLERRLVSRSVGFTLLGLRIGVLLTLMLTLIQPVLTKQFDVAQRGRVIVAVDASQSMETQDRHAALAEKLRWAQALGMLGNAETTPLLEQWVKSAEAGEEPDWLGTGAAAGNAVDQAAAEARARQIRDTLNELAEMPRVEFVRRLLQAQPRTLLTRLEEVMPVDLRLFAGQQKSAMAKDLNELLTSNRADLIPGATDAIQMLQAVTSEEDANQIRGVVLISDGRQTTPGDVASVAERMTSLGIPVFTIPIGSRLPPRDLSIAAVDSPETIFLNDKAQVRAVIGTSGFEGEPLTIRLERDGVTIDQQTVTPATDSAAVTFSIPSNQPGRFGYQLTTDVQPGELRDDNNRREVSLNVVDNKARVMLVEGDARWEFRYLKNLLDRDKQVESRTVLFRQPFLQILNEPYIDDRLPAADAFREELSRTDLLIVGDLIPQDIDAAAWDMVEQAVAKDGLTLIVIPGRRGMPQGFESPSLSSLLPVSDFRQRTAEQFRATAPDTDQSVFRLTLTPEAATLPMLQMTVDPANHSGSLGSLPGHPWIYAGTPKPGATVWANSTISGENTPPEPTLIHHDYGFGQVVWMGIDSTWRWRLRAGDEWHYRFWGQLIRWAARNKASAGNNDVRMSLSDVLVDTSETVETVVRWDPKLLPQLAGATVEVVATLVAPIDSPVDQDAGNGRKGKTPGVKAKNAPTPEQIVVALKPAPDAAERYIGRLPALKSGTWKIELRTTGGTFALRDSVQSEILVKEQLSAELANVACNRDLLTQLAVDSGGQVVEPYDAEQLISLVQPRDQSQQKIQERTLWDHWSIVLVFFTLLTSEWVIRKLNGLP